MGKLEKLDIGTGMVQPGWKAYQLHLEASHGWLGRPFYHIHFAPISDALCTVQHADGVDEGIRLDGFETACWISAWAAEYLSASDLALMSEMTSLA